MARPKLEHAGTEYVCIVKSDMPHELATLFAGLDAKGQADFFSFVALASDRWEKAPCFQWAALSAKMDQSAKRCFRDMAEHILEVV